MKVLHVIPSVSAVHGGPSIALDAMTRSLAQAGVTVDVATTDDDGSGHLKVRLGEPVLRDGVQHWFFARQTNFYKVSLPLSRWLSRNIAHYDLAHIHALFSFSALPAGWFAARDRVPYIVRPLGVLNHYGMTKHHPTFKRVSFTLIEKRILKRASFLHYTSAAERSEAEKLGVTTRSVVIPHGIDVDAFRGGADRGWIESHAPLLRDRVVFIFLSRLDPKKRLELLLDAFSRAQNGCMGLVIAGDGDPSYVQSLRARADARLGDAVVWAGFVEGDEKAALLRSADAFVLPSASENFGLAVAEAMAAGLPVIVTPEVGIADRVRAVNAGIVVSGETPSLEQALHILAENESLRREMGARGRAFARETFSLAEMTRALMDMYKTAIQESEL